MKRPYSTKYTARGVPRRYLLSGIPPTLWEVARARAKREGVAMRTLILSLLETWAKRPPLTSEEIDARVVAEADDDGAWDPPVRVPPARKWKRARI